MTLHNTDHLSLNLYTNQPRDHRDIMIYSLSRLGRSRVSRSRVVYSPIQVHVPTLWIGGLLHCFLSFSLRRTIPTCVDLRDIKMISSYRVNGYICSRKTTSTCTGRLGTARMPMSMK